MVELIIDSNENPVGFMVTCIVTESTGDYLAYSHPRLLVYSKEELLERLLSLNRKLITSEYENFLKKCQLLKRGVKYSIGIAKID